MIAKYFDIRNSAFALCMTDSFDIRNSVFELCPGSDWFHKGDDVRWQWREATWTTNATPKDEHNSAHQYPSPERGNTNFACSSIRHSTFDIRNSPRFDPFEEKMPRLIAELEAQFAESAKLESAIRRNLAPFDSSHET
jgi:hypothetical protein